MLRLYEAGRLVPQASIPYELADINRSRHELDRAHERAPPTPSYHPCNGLRPCPYAGRLVCLAHAQGGASEGVASSTAARGRRDTDDTERSPQIGQRDVRDRDRQEL